jgi:AcrR family transcriptional regulator
VRRDHRELLQRIKSIAREQMARDGAASLSMGKVARELGMTPPALYRYVPSREALVLDLMLDAYQDLHQASLGSLLPIAEEDLAGRFSTLYRTYRQWALSHPSDYALLHGATGPRSATAELRLQAEVAQTVRCFVDVLQRAEELGRLRVPAQLDQLPPDVEELFRTLGELSGAPVPRLLLLGYSAWLPLHALIWQEITHGFPGTAAEFLFELELANQMERLGLSAQA